MQYLRDQLKRVLRKIKASAHSGSSSDEYSHLFYTFTFYYGMVVRRSGVPGRRLGAETTRDNLPPTPTTVSVSMHTSTFVY